MQPADAGHREGRRWALPQQQRSAAGRSEREHGVNWGETSEYTGSSDCPCRATAALAIKFQKLPASFLNDFHLVNALSSVFFALLRHCITHGARKLISRQAKSSAKI